ncbi:three-helix bundle dimerization domain-containing protein [Nocardia sp. NPDC127526]|uniref:three-helix bundle dimerization domain-containing protein n=1 Tax=Nocardia sp. NPDC127526 TaxID=3345393 RepID=UPI003635C4D3
MRNDEDTQIRFVIERLTTRHPDVAPGIITALVGHVRESFAGARVRTFVPLLVERRAAEQLAAVRI